MKYFFLVLDSSISDFPDTAQPFSINSGSSKANLRFSSSVDSEGRKGEETMRGQNLLPPLCALEINSSLSS